MQCRAFRFQGADNVAEAACDSGRTIRLSRSVSRLQRVGRGSPSAACRASSRGRFQIHLLDVGRQMLQRGALQIVVDR